MKGILKKGMNDGLLQTKLSFDCCFGCDELEKY